MVNIKIDQFQGPLSLLLKIIEKDELDITSINLARIADEYLDYIEKNRDQILAERMADFLLMASKLLYIKSRALLPYLNNDEEDDVEDLEKQLKMYKEFVDLSAKIQLMIAGKRFSFSRVINKSNKRFSFLGDYFFPPDNVSKESLHKSFLSLIKKNEEEREELEERTMKSEISIEDRVSFIRSKIKSAVNFNFSKMLKGAKDKTELIVSLLAVLELLKQRELLFEQDSLFSEIYLKNNIEK